MNDGHKKSYLRLPRVTGVLSWVVVTSVALVLLAIASVNIFDSQVIQRAAAKDRLEAFLRAAQVVSQLPISPGDEIPRESALQDAFRDIMALRPGLRHLSFFSLTTNVGTLIASTDVAADRTLSKADRLSVLINRPVTRFDDTSDDRGWMITAPVFVKGRAIGALRGKFSIAKYDRLIEEQRAFGMALAVAMVVLTTLIFLFLLRVQVHRPVTLLLSAMRNAEAGDLSSKAPLGGSWDIREVAGQYNHMLDRIRQSAIVKEQLLEEIHGFNDKLKEKVSETTEELRRANALLVEARTQAERAEKLAALGELSAVIAHELGNPLNAISGNLQMLEQDTTQQDHDRHLAVVRDEIKRMTGTLHHILESTRVKVERRPVDINAVVHDVLTVNAPILLPRPIELTTDLPEGLALIAGDVHGLHGVIFNLVTNAIQAMPEGGELSIVTRYVRDESVDGIIILPGSYHLKAGAVRLIVRDTGPGIPREHINRIFEPFFTTRGSHRGTGLGLAICHRVISSAGGRLAVHSVVGIGTTFTIDLPLWKERHPGDASDDV
jgi:signal transduction histidine kinase